MKPTKPAAGIVLGEEQLRGRPRYFSGIWTRLRRLLGRGAWVGVILLGLSLPENGLGQKAARPEAEVKAGFLKVFISLTDWPASTFQDTNAPIILGVLGSDRMTDYLRSEPNLPNGRRLLLKELAGVEGAEGCNVVFIPASSATSLSEIVARLKDAPVLTVVESPLASRTEGIIQLRKEVENDVLKFRYDVNNAAAQRSNLRLSSKLLKLAKNIY